MNTTRTFAILLAALTLISGTPILVVAAQEPAVERPHEKTSGAAPIEITHHQLGLRF